MITRTINVTKPDGQITTTTQVAKLHRDAIVDDVTGEVSYGDWTEDTWADFKPGQIAGYTISQADVPAVTVKDGQKAQIVSITYAANEQATHVVYKDGDRVVKNVLVNGETDQTVNLNYATSEYYKIINQDSLPQNYTFKATISIARKPKYFLGIKIHRAILQISWELTSEYTDTQVVDVLTLDPNASDEEKTRQVNSRISEIAQEFPSCSITTEYAKSEATQTADNDDVIHLLWSSDRLEIAREVDSRITKIYADLVSLEKMMHYKRSIIDVLKDILPSIDADQGRRRTLIEECYERWRENADPNRGNGEDNENEN